MTVRTGWIGGHSPPYPVNFQLGNFQCRNTFRIVRSQMGSFRKYVFLHFALLCRYVARPPGANKKRPSLNDGAYRQEKNLDGDR